jgi:hypothetical protein
LGKEVEGVRTRKEEERSRMSVDMVELSLGRTLVTLYKPPRCHQLRRATLGSLDETLSCKQANHGASYLLSDSLRIRISYFEFSIAVEEFDIKVEMNLQWRRCSI